MDVWRKGWTIFTEYPLTGVGANNLSMAIGNLRKDLGVLPFWQTAHSSWVQILVEIGIFGMVLWAILLASTVGTLWRLRRLDGSSGTNEIGIWAGVLLVGFLGQLVSSSFLSMGYSILFTLFFAVAVALRQIASASDGSATPPDARIGHLHRQPAKGVAWRRPGLPAA
jgi:O-antigen ligase